MKTLDVHRHAVEDIGEIRRKDVKAAAAILATLEQIDADPYTIDKLTTYGDNQFGAYRLGIKRWESARRKGNLWRFRILDTPATGYRIVYGYHYQTRLICVLAVVRKDEFDYDDFTSNLAKRIFSDWNAL